MTRFTLVQTLVFVLGFVSTSRADLIARWSGDGNTNDSVAGRNGTLVNGAGFDSGHLGQAFRLDGANDYVSVPDDNAWTFGSNPFTISLFANFDVVNSDFNIFIGHDTGPGLTGKWVFFYDDEGSLVFHINGPAIGSEFITSPTTFFPTIGEFHHFAITRSGSTYTFFADGASLGAATSSLVIPNTNAPLTIGQAEGLGFIDGRLDEIRIYDEALSASQIGQLSAVPEPSGMVLLSIVGIGLIDYRCRRRKKTA